MGTMTGLKFGGAVLVGVVIVLRALLANHEAASSEAVKPGDT